MLLARPLPVFTPMPPGVWIGGGGYATMPRCRTSGINTHLMQRLTQMREIMTVYDTEPLELMLGLFSLSLCLITLYPHFTAPIVGLLTAARVSRVVFALLMLVCGGLRLWAVTGVTARRTLYQRRVAAQVSFPIWLFYAVDRWRADRLGLGTVCMACCALSSLLIFSHLTREIQQRRYQRRTEESGGEESVGLVEGGATGAAVDGAATEEGQTHATTPTDT